METRIEQGNSQSAMETRNDEGNSQNAIETERSSRVVARLTWNLRVKERDQGNNSNAVKTVRDGGRESAKSSGKSHRTHAMVTMTETS